MKADAALLFYNTLMGSEGYQAVMGVGDDCKLYPLIAPEGTNAPYSVYRVDDDGDASKDVAKRYYCSVVLVFPADGYLAALQLEGVVQDLFKDSFFTYETSPTDYDEDTQYVVSVISFSITDY